MLTMRDEVAFMGKLVLPSEEVAYMGKVVSTGRIDTQRVNRCLDLIMDCLQLIISILTVVMDVINTLDTLAAAFWQVWDEAIIGLRWYLCPVPVAMG